MRSKYGARKTVVDGITFDSKREAERYSELKLLERAGKIEGLRRQVSFELLPAQYEYTGEVFKRGEKAGQPKTRLIERAVTYIADFVYFETELLEINGVTVKAPLDKRSIVEDVKGVRTPEYVIKRKLFRYLYGKNYEFREVR